MKIGVFDSGRGGEFIADGLRTLLPEHEYIVVNDRDNVPYGSRTDEEVTSLTEAAIRSLIQTQCPIIVIACNTATMASIAHLRTAHPDTYFVGIEPMVKPAAARSLSRHITVLATPLTLASDRYGHLKSSYANGITIDEPQTAGWASYIEHGTTDAISIDGVADSVAQGSDIIVLACTHYLALRKRLHEAFPSVSILEPTEAIARQISALRDAHDL
jgi:glutamate racemase